ncbi:MAG: hypothetical protein C4309_00640 [Chloroflexota bacterium]
MGKVIRVTDLGISWYSYDDRTVTLTFLEGDRLKYKVPLGGWERVEKGPACEELPNRVLTVVYGTSGTMTTEDTVAKWRDIDNCG